MDADRNLLFGVLALQADYITGGQFAEACAAWAARKDSPLADLLVERGWLSSADREDVEKLLRRKLDRHVGDVRASLAEVTTDHVRASLAAITDSDVRESLTDTPPRGHVLLNTTEYVPEARDRYTLSRLHATGGIGRIWLARDPALGRDVALKEIRPERAANSLLWARFMREARITGQLEHPGIVPVYELSRRGEDNQPFYTMRFVRGRTLAEAVRAYHKERRDGTAGALEFRALLTAFAGVCNAVAYAHSRGVVHRDLKPSNVVLGDYGEVMLLDWGLAKLVDQPDDEKDAAPVTPDPVSADGETEHGQVLGTPAYMAPEQAEGRLAAIGPATDVYGLGAMLYQVLTARPPFAGDDTTAVLRLVVHEAPTRPSEHVANTPPALEAVCLKAISKKPKDRYASPLDLAGEVQHWLADEPVAAYREPVSTRLARWARRHRPLVAGTAALLATAVVALGVGTFLLGQKNREIATERDTANVERNRATEAATRADTERDRATRAAAQAETERNRATRAAGRAEAVNRFLVQDMLASATPERTRGRKVTVEEVLGEAARKVETAFAGQPEIESETRLALAGAYGQLGLHREGEPHLRKALDLAREFSGPDGDETLTARNNLGENLEKQGRFADAEPFVAETLAVRRRKLGDEDPQTLATLNVLGVLLRRQGEFVRSEGVFRELLALRRRISGPDHKHTLTAMSNLTLLLQDQGKFPEAELLTRDCLAARRRTIGDDHPETILSINNLALVLENQGKRADAIPIYRESLALHRRVMTSEHPQTLTVLLNLAGLLAPDKWEEAEPLFKECIAGRRKALPPDHPDTANALVRYGDALTRRGGAKDAEPLLREGLAMRTKAYPPGHPITAYSQVVLASCLAELRRFDEAEPLALGGYETLRRAAGFPRQRLADMAARILKLYETWGDKPDKVAQWTKERDDAAKPPAKP